MNIPNELVTEWFLAAQEQSTVTKSEYIAQRAAEWVLSQSVSMEHVTDGSQCWCNPDVIEEDNGSVIVHNYEDNWQQYAKPGETAQQCIERHRAEQDALMTLYAQPKAQEPVSMEPVAWGIVASNTGRICQVELDADEVAEHNPKYIVPLYTAAQLAQARQQGAEEERKKRLDWAVAWKELDVNVLHSRIADLEKSNAGLLELISRAGKVMRHNLAVVQDGSSHRSVMEYNKVIDAIAEVKP